MIIVHGLTEGSKRLEPQMNADKPDQFETAPHHRDARLDTLFAEENQVFLAPAKRHGSDFLIFPMG
jgi:hypothetical protein